MPIRPENRARYPKNWTEISHHIRFERAKARCECTGECGIDHYEEMDACKGPDYADNTVNDAERCFALHGIAHYATGAKVILTVAHLPGREIEQCEGKDLKAMCQRCHNRMDAPLRRAGIRQRARQKCAVGDLLVDTINQKLIAARL